MLEVELLLRHWLAGNDIPGEMFLNGLGCPEFHYQGRQSPRMVGWIRKHTIIGVQPAQLT